MKDCRQHKRERGSCYECGSPDHQVKQCPKKKTIKKEDKEVCSIGLPSDEDNFRQDVMFQISDDVLVLNILLDTGSPISLIKEEYLNNFNDNTSQYFEKFEGINSSKLIILGTVKADITERDVKM